MYGQYNQYAYGNPFQQTQPTFQMPTQQFTQSPLAGRIVKSAEEIAPNEVPMDGTAAFFPSANGSLIFAKAWNKDGSISTVQYAPIHPESKEEDEAPTLADVMDQLQNIRDLLNAKPKPRRSTKKEAADDTSE